MKSSPTLQLPLFALFFSGLALFLCLWLWFRSLGFSQTQDNAVILVLFTLGLAFGSLTSQQYLKKHTYPLRLFIRSQMVAALTVAILLPILASPEYLITQLPSQTIVSFDGVIATLLITFIPAITLGMAFPLLTHKQTYTQHISRTSVVSASYTTLIFSACVATLLGGFYLMPQFGLTGTLYSAAMCSLLAALSALALLKKTPPVPSPSPTSESKKTHSFSSLKLIIVISLISVIWLGSEIIWVKILTLYAGTTLYSVSFILAFVLAGMTLGSWIFYRWQARHSLLPKHLVILLIALFFTLNLTRLFLSHAPSFYHETHYLGELFNHLDSLWFLLIILLPSLLFGALFSLSFALYDKQFSSSTPMGNPYALYLLCSIAGAIATTLWLIPTLGSHTTLLIFSITPLLLAGLLLPKPKMIQRRIIQYITLGGLVALALFIPPLSIPTILEKHHYRYLTTENPVIHLRVHETPSGLINLTLYKQERLHLQHHGVTQSKVHIRHPHKGDINESLTALLPVLLQENATEALVLGFKTGLITRVLANSDLEGVVTTIEPEPKVVESMLVLNLMVNFIFLDDGRAEIEYLPLRDALRQTKECYSIITAQAPYIWEINATRLYSQEFFNLVKSRLKPEGIFGFHLNLLRIDTPTLQSILQTFYHVFPKGAVFGNPEAGGLVLLGSQQPLVLDLDRTQTYFKEQTKAMETIHYGDLRHPHELPRYFLFSRKTAQHIAADAPLITDNNLLIESQIYRLSDSLPQGKQDPFQLFNQYVNRPRDRL